MNFMTWDKPSGENCPKCGNFLTKKVLQGKNSQLKCSNEECDFTKVGRKKKIKEGI